jgi:toxin HigB-1
VIRSFGDGGSEDIYSGKDTKKARRVCPKDIWNVVRRKFDMLDAAEELKDLKVPPANHLESLRGDRDRQHSIRINDQYRICFVWTDAGPEQVEIVDYH